MMLCDSRIDEPRTLYSHNTTAHACALVFKSWLHPHNETKQSISIQEIATITIVHFLRIAPNTNHTKTTTKKSITLEQTTTIYE